jgi:hypothetical protein
MRKDDGVAMLAMPGFGVTVGTVRIIPGWVKGDRYVIAVRGKRTLHMERTATIWGAANTSETAPEQAARAILAWAKQDEHRKLDRVFTRDLRSTRVSLADSRRAGNCVEGALKFAERRLGIGRAEILAGGHLLHVPASRIMAAAGTEAEPARRACYAAWLRETTVSI